MRTGLLLLAGLLCVLAIACSGGSGGAGGSGEAPPKVLPGTAKFHVDVASGQVSVTAPGSSGRAVLLGGTVSLSSSLLLDQPGNTGLKVINVAVTNRWAADIGRDPSGVVSGLRVLFSPFVAAAAFEDLRPKVTVDTLVGPTADTSLDGPLSSATFRAPSAAAVGADGAIYVTDLVANRVRKIQGGLVSTLAGQATAGALNGFGTAAQFSGPFGVAVNPLDGSLVVGERTGNRVRRVTPAGRVTTIAGTGAAGAANGSGAVATLNGPSGVAVAADGTIFVAERDGHRIRKIALVGADPAVPASYLVSTLAGSGTAGFADRVGTAAQFNQPFGLALGPDGRLYAADFGNRRIRVVEPDGAVATIAGTGASTSLDGDGDTATFSQPIGVVWAGQALVVTEFAGQVVRQLTLKAGGSAAPGNAPSWTVQTLAGSTTAGTPVLADGDGTAARFFQMQLPAVDGFGNVVIPDAGHHAVRRVSPPNGLFPVGTPGGTGDAGQVRLANGDGLIPSSIFGPNLPFVRYAGALAPGASTAAQPWVFVVPAGVTAFEFMVTVEADTAVLTAPEAVLNSGAPVLGSPAVRVRTLTGLGQGYRDGDLSVARFFTVNALARDAAGNLYAADGQNHVVRRIGTDGRVSTVAGRGSSGNGPDGPGNTAFISAPEGIAVTPDGSTVYVAEFSRSRVRAIFFTGSDRTNSADWTVATLVGSATTGAAGNVDGSGDVASLSGPAGLVLAGPDELFVVERQGNRVRRLRFLGGDRRKSINWRVSLVAGDGSAVAGAAGDTDGIGTAARFRQPFGITMDQAGRLYVTDRAAHRVRRILEAGAASASFVTVETFVGGTLGLADGLGAAARLNGPTGIAIDAAGYLYFNDAINRRVRRISPAGEVATIAGSASTASSKDGTGATAEFTSPFGIVADPSGNLYIGDSSAIRLVQRALTASSP